MAHRIIKDYKQPKKFLRDARALAKKNDSARKRRTSR
jgi:hypothetical protein